MDKGDGVAIAALPAAVDDLLGTALHFGVVALDAGEVQVLLVRGAGLVRGLAAGLGAGRAAAQADEHGRTAERDECVAGEDLAFLDVFGTDIAETAGEHDGFAVAEAGAVGAGLLERAKVAAQVGSAELIVEGGRAKWALGHDVERAGDVARFAVVILPGLGRLRQVEVRDREAAEPGFGLRAAACSTLVADLAAGAGGGAGPGGNGCGMVVGFHLAKDVDLFRMGCVFVVGGIGKVAAALAAADDGGVVAVGGEHVRIRRAFVSVADHAEKGTLGRNAVDGPAGVEDLVPAVFAIGLRKHVELDVGRIAAECPELAQEIVDFVGRER